MKMLDIDSVEDTVGDLVYNSVRDLAWNSVRNLVWNTVRDLVWTSVHPVCNLVCDSVEENYHENA